MDWPDVVFRITSEVPESRVQGTGFACGRDETGAYVVTCWHVVRDIGVNNLRIGGLSCEVVSSPGDNDLDLAVLRVQGLQPSQTLQLGTAGADGLPFETYGYEPVGRPLSGKLGANTSRPHRSGRDVPAWDYYLREGGRELDRIKDGYSGAPVYDPQSDSVVAVITHRQGGDKGFAIDLGNLKRVYPRADDFLTKTRPRGVEADPEPTDEYSQDQGVVLAKMLDHGEQLASIDRLFEASNDGAATDRGIALFDACADDWPSYLADHVHLDHWPDRGGTPPEAITLNLDRSDKEAFWDALIREIPGVCTASDPVGQRAMVRDWINGAPLRVFHVTVVLERDGRKLPAMIHGARDTLAGLGELSPGTRLLVLFAAVTGGSRPPFWWRWFKRFKLQRLDCCRSLGALRRLDKSDIERWHSSFPRPLRGYYDRDRLKADLLGLFDDNKREIRYEQARRRLVDEQAIERARRQPRNP